MRRARGLAKLRESTVKKSDIVSGVKQGMMQMLPSGEIGII